MKLVCGRAACRDAFATGGGEFLRAARFQQDCNETQVGVLQPRVLAEADAPMALDQCSDLPNRHAAVRRNRYHAESCWKIESKPVIHSASDTLQAELLAQLNSVSPAKKQALPQDVADWIGNQMSLHVAAREAEWSGREIYVALPQPGGDAWLSIDLATGEVQYERTDRGWISYLNDLHKGRNTGFAWSVFLDVFAIACVVFCVTGLVLLQLLSSARPSTWPLVGLGLVIPVLLAIFFIH